MQEVVILSGKGGTGKTTIVGSFAALAGDAVLADCDVDAADLHLLLKPEILQDNDFYCGQEAKLDSERCNQCWLCEQLCRFDAIHDLRIEDASCEGCGFCANACPAGAIDMVDRLAGRWFISKTDYGTLVHSRLGIAQENSGKLVALVKQQARAIAERDNLRYIIGDGPPGIGCPVISMLSGANLALIVTEPTLSGLHDLDRVLQTCEHFGVPALVCINKYDINEENTSIIEQQCREKGVEVVARIPFDPVVMEALQQGLPVVKFSSGDTAGKIEDLWQKVRSRLN